MLQEQDKIIPLTRIICETQRKIDNLEWDGDFERADFETKFLKHLETLQDQGDTWYPLF